MSDDLGESAGGVAALVAEMHELVDALVQLDPEGIGYSDTVAATEAARDALRWAFDNAAEEDEDTCCHHPGTLKLCEDCGERHMSPYSCACDCHPELTPDPEDYVQPGESSCRYSY